MKQNYSPADVFKLTNSILDVPSDFNGLDYLNRVAENIFKVFEFKYIFFGYAIKPDYIKVQTVVSMVNGEPIENFVYDLEGTPCQNVFTGNRVCIHPEGVASRFPDDEMLVKMGVESYIGAPTIIENKLFGLVAILDPEKIVDIEFYVGLLEFIAARISVELERYTHKHQIEELKRQADLDPLTQCLNRNALEDSFKRVFFEYNNSALMFVDADYFKKINDTYGHQYGDDVLVMLSETFKKLCRDGDLICRFGGEEFVIYLPNIGLEEARLIAERIHSYLNNLKDKKVTVSIGLTNCSNSESLDDAILRADKAVYMAKENGRNRTEIIS